MPTTISSDKATEIATSTITYSAKDKATITSDEKATELEAQERYATVLGLIVQRKLELLEAVKQELALYKDLCCGGRLDNRGKKIFRDILAGSLSCSFIADDVKKEEKKKRRSKVNKQEIVKAAIVDASATAKPSKYTEFMSGIINFCEKNSIDVIVNHEDVWVSMFAAFLGTSKSSKKAKSVDILSYLRSLDCSECIPGPETGELVSIDVNQAKSALQETLCYDADVILPECC
jgi:hypothetical protein